MLLSVASPVVLEIVVFRRGPANPNLDWTEVSSVVQGVVLEQSCPYSFYSLHGGIVK